MLVVCLSGLNPRGEEELLVLVRILAPICSRKLNGLIKVVQNPLLLFPSVLMLVLVLELVPSLVVPDELLGNLSLLKKFSVKKLNGIEGVVTLSLLLPPPPPPPP